MVDTFVAVRSVVDMGKIWPAGPNCHSGVKLQDLTINVFNHLTQREGREVSKDFLMGDCKAGDNSHV